MQPLRGRNRGAIFHPGCAAATLGCGIQPLRGKDRVATGCLGCAVATLGCGMQPLRSKSSGWNASPQAKYSSRPVSLIFLLLLLLFLFFISFGGRCFVRLRFLVGLPFGRLASIAAPQVVLSYRPQILFEVVFMRGEMRRDLVLGQIPVVVGLAVDAEGLQNDVEVVAG